MQLTKRTYCTATMNYAKGVDDIEPVSVEVHNGRLANDLRWEENGFQLFQHTSRVDDWSDDAEIEQKYYGEMEAFAKALAGCDHALLAEHISRNPEAAKVHQDYAPIEYVHSDFTESYGDLVRGLYDRSEPGAAEALQRAGLDGSEIDAAPRLLILQFWRNIGPSVMDLPIAFCDSQSVPAEDVFAIHVPNYANAGQPFDTFGERPAGGGDHRWYTFPEMRANEVVAFRTYDSACVNGQQPFWTPHSAFADPLHDNAPARYSIEVRATCVYLK